MIRLYKILSKKNISEIITDFTRAAELAVAAGFNMIDGGESAVSKHRSQHFHTRLRTRMCTAYFSPPQTHHDEFKLRFH